MGVTEDFDLGIDRIINEIKNRNARKVGLQFPEGLKRRSFSIASEIENKTGAEVQISANPCYGACDLDRQLLETMDLVFHFGHSTIREDDGGKVIYIEARSPVDLGEVVRKAIPLFEGIRIGLITTVQHVHKLEGIRRLLEEVGKEGVIAEGDSRIAYPGQVLGCNFSAAFSEDCDEYLYIGGGQFHPIGVALCSKKPVIIADPYLNEVRKVDTHAIMKKRYAAIGKAMNSKVVAIVVSTKTGQQRMELAKYLLRSAKKKGLQAYILTMDLVSPEQLLNFKVDVIVNTACPRIAIDDAGRYPAPMLTPPEFEIVLGEREELVFDEIRGE
ncbi:diphthamide biosynthesis enzyme Dph2 [Methanohalophilus sp.]|uniref:diphthamide biosynthesis enzyme Dph2 n=1 Tax=Methanohalophilus sp. TaxID=1966352 RepID=UPI0026354BE0|nr:diphthamide biosynthesis enzyme Dph2 [Methanohalophilus sp.]MDK2891732.1 2-(3-amino-3-carboxypropyl)histidine synthase [Methanohalophilus sp.]